MLLEVPGDLVHPVPQVCQPVLSRLAGGVRIDEPGLDLGIATSIISSLKDISVSSQTVVVGEIGLGGEVRSVGQVDGSPRARSVLIAASMANSPMSWPNASRSRSAGLRANGRACTR